MLLVELVLFFGIGWGGRGGGEEGLAPFLHSSPRRCITGFFPPSLLKRIAHRFFSSSRVRRHGGIEASVLRAWIGVVRKAAHIRRRALLCMRSR